MLSTMKRLDCLDGVRGLLAVYVLLGHMAPFAVLPAWVQNAVSHGGAAVDVFFVLSGLVITQSLLRAGGQAAPFLIARVARIFPVFLAVFAVSIAVEPWSCGFEFMPWIGPDDVARTICVKTWPHAWLPEIAAHLTLVHGLFPYAVWPDVWVSFLGAAWSLSTEWQFYLLALLVATRSRRLYVILLGLALAGVAWRLTVAVPWQFSRAFLPNKAHFFALGVASVPLVNRERGAILRYALVLISALAICATAGSPSKLLPPLAWSFCLAIQIRPDLTGLRHASRLLCSRAIRYLGAISYCVYLVNEPIHKTVGEALSRFASGDGSGDASGDGRLFTALWIPLSIGLPLLVAALLHRYLEVPALRVGRDFARRISSPSVAAPSVAAAVQARG
jgi:peptidoglycan/LPS O-acetylase OafA/YrhL